MIFTQCLRIYRQKIYSSYYSHGKWKKFICKYQAATRNSSFIYLNFLGASFFLGSFFLKKVPSNVHSTPRCEPHPSFSSTETDEEAKVNCKTQKSTSE
ncbi:MAG TPA: hypothetical protein VGG71_03840, partial [Chitinophagaceae bacterium]